MAHTVTSKVESKSDTTENGMGELWVEKMPVCRWSQPYLWTTDSV